MSFAEQGAKNGGERSAKDAAKSGYAAGEAKRLEAL